MNQAISLSPGAEQIERLRVLRGQNSVEFLETVFECYRSGEPFAIERGDTDIDRLVRTARDAPLAGGGTKGWMSLDARPSRSPSPAQVVFSSGTEGRPKAIVLSHANLADVIERLNGLMQPTSDIREYLGIPATYSFGIGRARAVAAAGGQLFIPERFDPMEIKSMLERGEINAISAVPSLWRVVLQAGDLFGSVGDRVRWIEIGSQLMTGEEKAQLKRLFPAASIVQHYGLTEASRSTLLDVSNTDGPALDSVGRAVGSVEVRIDEGVIAIRGDHVAMGQLTEGGVIVPLTDRDGWLKTKDLGRLEDGFLHFEGRADDQVNIGGLKFHPEAAEAEIAGIVPGATGHVAIGPRPDPMRGQTAIVALEDEAGDLAPVVAAATETVLRRNGIEPSGAYEMLRVESLPRTGTGKVQRSKLSGMVRSAPTHVAGAPDRAAAPELTPEERRVEEAWRQVQAFDVISPDDSIYSLGVDSLTSLQIAMTMEARGLPKRAVQATLRGETVRQVASCLSASEARDAAAPLPSRTAEVWANNSLRGLMILAVLLSHWGPGVTERLAIDQAIAPLVAMAYRIGTEGFAAAFGISIGATVLHDFRQNRKGFERRNRLSLILLIVGVSLLAGVHIVKYNVGSVTVTPELVSRSFYTVLAFYTIAIGTAPFWLAGLQRLRDRPDAIFLLALVFTAFNFVMLAILPDGRTGNGLEFFRLMLGAGAYNIFSMFGIVLAGIAIGIVLRRSGSNKEMPGVFITTGLAAAIAGLIAGTETLGLAAFGDPYSPAWRYFFATVLFVGLSTAILGGFLMAFRRYQRIPGPARLPLQVLVTLGGLSLPIYVFHELVIPVKDILVTLGWGYLPALALPMALFLAAMSYLGARLYRSYF